MRALRRQTRGVFLVALLGSLAAQRASARAEEHALAEHSPFGEVVRRHYYERLEKGPLRALGLELALPGAGTYYVGLYVSAACTLALSLGGAGMWIAGARREHPVLMWSGVGVLAGARVFGVASAPIGALLLNAAFRRQLGLIRTF